jgi:rhodanese-related sulfurtransferase
MNQVIIDVREKDEFNSEFISESLHFPLSSLGSDLERLLTATQGRSVLLMCQSGKRAILAKGELDVYFQNKINLAVFQGGLSEWKAQGRSVVRGGERKIPIARQVQIFSGGLVLISSVLAQTVDIHFALLACFVGAGLTFAGFSGSCYLASLLSQLPYNTHLSSSSKKLTQ